MIVILSVWRGAANPAQANRSRLLATALVVASACTQPAREQVASVAGDSTSDSARMERVRPHVVPVPRLALPPLADSIANRLTFVPTTQSAFVVTVHDGKLLVDLGRVDDNVAKTPERLAAYRVAVESQSPLPKGTRVRVRGPWSTADATIESFDAWTGRIVGVLEPAPSLDSAQGSSPRLLGLAELSSPATTGLPNAPALPATTATATTATPPAATPSTAGDAVPPSTAPNATTPGSPLSCSRLWNDAVRARASSVRDSLERVLRAGDQPVYTRLLTSLKTKRSMIPGCFPDGNALIIVALYGGDFEWVREKIVLLTNSGGVRTIPVRDYRMRAHELLDAFDADDNGTDDVAARGFTHRAGAQVVLRFTENRLERIAAGFAWER